MIRQAKAVALAFLIVGLGLLTAGVISYFHSRTFVSGAIRTTAAVIDLEYRSSSGGHGGYVTVLSFIDKTRQTQTTRTQNAQNPAPVAVGQTVKILYLPSDPESAQIESFNGLWLTTLLLAGAGVAFFAMGLVVLVSVQRMSRDDEAA